MDPIVRRELEYALERRRRVLEENRDELARARSRVSTLETFVVEEAAAVSALERELPEHYLGDDCTEDDLSHSAALEQTTENGDPVCGCSYSRPHTDGILRLGLHWASEPNDG